MMTRLLLASVLGCAATVAAAAEGASEKKMSIGLQVGRYLNQGVSGQYLLQQNGAINANAGLVFGTLTLSGDYIYQFTDRAADYDSQRGEWIPYVGGGLQTGLIGGIRGVAGTQYQAVGNPFNFFISLLLLPSASDFEGHGVGGMLGGRCVL